MKNMSIPVAQMVESIVGCKWSLRVLSLIRDGVNRPGQMQRATPGMSTKVLNERLHKLVRFGIVTRTVLPVIPPHVEYTFTPFGMRFSRLLRQIERLQETVGPADPAESAPPRRARRTPRRRAPLA